MVEVYSKEIAKLEDPEVAAEDEEELKKIRQKLADENRGIADLEKFYTDVTKDWGDSERLITLQLSPLTLSLKGLPRTGVCPCSMRIARRPNSGCLLIH